MGVVFLFLASLCSFSILLLLLLVIVRAASKSHAYARSDEKQCEQSSDRAIDTDGWIPTAAAAAAAAAAAVLVESVSAERRLMTAPLPLVTESACVD